MPTAKGSIRINRVSFYLNFDAQHDRYAPGPAKGKTLSREADRE
jgi:hypothetical protein